MAIVDATSSARQARADSTLSMTSVPVLLLAALALAGCRLVGSDGGVQLYVDRNAYQTPDTIRATLFNGSAKTMLVGTSLCGSTLGVVGSSEVIQLDEVCTLAGRELAPGESLEAERPIPADVPAGKYVLRYEISADGEAVSAPFDVE